MIARRNRLPQKDQLAATFAFRIFRFYHLVTIEGNFVWTDGLHNGLELIGRTGPAKPGSAGPDQCCYGVPSLASEYPTDCNEELGNEQRIKACENFIGGAHNRFGAQYRFRSTYTGTMGNSRNSPYRWIAEATARSSACVNRVNRLVSMTTDCFLRVRFQVPTI